MSAKPSTHSGAVAVVKDTSREAYRKLGVPTLDERVYNTLHGNKELCTRRELASHMGEEASTIAGAVNRLAKRGLIITDARKIKCQVTGRNVECLLLPSEVGP